MLERARPLSRLMLTATVAVVLAGCGTMSGRGQGGASRTATADGASDRATTSAPIVQAGAPGAASRAVTEFPTGAPPRVHTQADVRFMQGMIAHHAQALVMTEMVPTRAFTDGMRMLAGRIEVSQTSEIALMGNWLRTRGEGVPTTGEQMHHHMGDGQTMMMPGMLTEDQLAEMRAATGAEFERLFLTYMIGHHEGALVMVAELFAQDGAAQDSDIFRFASDVDSDQRMEIRRMRNMLQPVSPTDNKSDNK